MSGPTTKPRPGFEPGPMQHILSDALKFRIRGTGQEPHQKIRR